MRDRVHTAPNLIYSAGTQVVALRDVLGPAGGLRHSRGTVGVVLRPPADFDHNYRVQFADGTEENLHRDEIVMLALHQEGEMLPAHAYEQLRSRVIYRCIIGSRAYGLDDDQSDTDYRGIFLPRADEHWALAGVPDQIENHETQEHYWELERFLVLALKANPNVLECLFSPLVETATPLARELLDMKSCFLSRLVYQTFNGYVMSQFRKLQADLRNQGAIKPKHAMHLIRLLISGIGILREGSVPMRVGQYRDELLSIKTRAMPWSESEKWRQSLHAEFDRAFAETKLPERPDYARANALLLRARRLALVEELP